jgi:hypothetical protein
MHTLKLHLSHVVSVLNFLIYISVSLESDNIVSITNGSLDAITVVLDVSYI